MGYSFSVEMKGKTQGAFKGEGSREATKNKSEGLSFAYDVKSPRDASTGQASGKRQHSPIKIVKEWGAATPQLFQALITNEVLTEVKLEFTKTSKDGEEFIYYRIKLVDAHVSEIRQFSREAVDGSTAKNTAAGGNELEEVSFTFRKIEVESPEGKTMGVDDWSTH